MDIEALKQLITDEISVTWLSRETGISRQMIYFLMDGSREGRKYHWLAIEYVLIKAGKYFPSMEEP